jgi:hypothetical protein
MSAILTELRHALRALRAQPAFALAAILTLALGIGANCAIFSLVEALLVRPLPYHDPESLVGATNYIRDFNAEMATGGDDLDWKDQSRLLSAVEAFRYAAGLTLTGRESVHAAALRGPSPANPVDCAGRSSASSDRARGARLANTPHEDRPHQRLARRPPMEGAPALRRARGGARSPGCLRRA